MSFVHFFVSFSFSFLLVLVLVLVLALLCDIYTVGKKVGGRADLPNAGILLLRVGFAANVM